MDLCILNPDPTWHHPDQQERGVGQADVELEGSCWWLVAQNQPQSGIGDIGDGGDSLTPKPPCTSNQSPIAASTTIEQSPQSKKEE